MSNDNQEVIRDKNGIPIPQFKDKATGQFVPHSGGAAPYQQMVDPMGSPFFTDSNPGRISSKDDGLKLIKTISFSSFVTGENKFYIDDSLNRIAKNRTFVLHSDMDVPSTNIKIGFYDSEIAKNSELVGTVYSIPANIGVDNSTLTITSEDNHIIPMGGWLASHTNSVFVSVTIDTLPTRGNLKIYVFEVF